MVPSRVLEISVMRLETERSRNLSPIMTWRPERMAGFTWVLTSTFLFLPTKVVMAAWTDSSCFFFNCGNKKRKREDQNTKEKILHDFYLLSGDDGDINDTTASLHEFCERIQKKKDRKMMSQLTKTAVRRWNAPEKPSMIFRESLSLPLAPRVRKRLRVMEENFSSKRADI